MSLALPGESQGIKKVETQPFDSGNDPNISTIISFKCKFPRDKLFSPTLTATVHDNIFAGFSQPLIGSFGIILGKYSNPNKQPLKLAAPLTKKKRNTNEMISNLEEIKEEEKDEKGSGGGSDIDTTRNLASKEGKDEKAFGELKNMPNQLEISFEEVCGNSNQI